MIQADGPVDSDESAGPSAFVGENAGAAVEGPLPA
jgi:hypothetical protein